MTELMVTARIADFILWWVLFVIGGRMMYDGFQDQNGTTAFWGWVLMILTLVRMFIQWHQYLIR